MQEKPKGLKLRGDVWWIDKIIRTRSGERVQVRESTKCRSLKDAIIVLELRQKEVEQRDVALNLTPKERTFMEAAAEYLADLERRGKSTERAKRDIVRLLPEIGHLPLSHIHQRTLQPWIDAQKGRLSSGSVKQVLKVISTVLNFSARVLRDGNTPWLAITPPRLIAPDWGARQPRPITWEEQDRLLTELPPYLVAPVLFLVGTGARHLEAVMLSWDWHREVLGAPKWAIWWVPETVRKASSRQLMSERTGRYIIANAAVREVIAAQVGLDDTRVFVSPKGGGFSAINNKGWRNAAQRAGLNIRLHDLRHTFGLRAADAGLPLDVRRSLLGHRHSDITLHYSKPGVLRLLEEAEKIVRPDRTMCETNMT